MPSVLASQGARYLGELMNWRNSSDALRAFPVV